MKFEFPLVSGTLIQRYKRFLADIKLEDGSFITAHCPNSGSMMGLKEPGNRVYVWDSKNPKRKLQYTWELVEVDSYLVGINTNRPNYLVKEAIENGVIKELQGYKEIKTEVKYGENSRLDLYLKNDDKECFVEVKNVTLVNNQIARFPDAVTSRGTKHLNELLHIVKSGKRGVVCFIIQRMDTSSFETAAEIDSTFSETLQSVVSKGVEVLAYQAKLSLDGIEITKKLPVYL
jgi:sugar fermentation stimulation protein A